MASNDIIWQYHPQRTIGRFRFINTVILLLAIGFIILTPICTAVGLLSNTICGAIGAMVGIVITISVAGIYYKKQSFNEGYTYLLTSSKAQILQYDRVEQECDLKNCTVLIMDNYRAHSGTSSGSINEGISVNYNLNSTYKGQSREYGTLIFREGGVTKLEFRNVRNPDKVLNLINQIHSESKTNTTNSDSNATVAQGDNESELEKIKKLKELMDSGAINPEEFEKRKQMVLDTIIK